MTYPKTENISELVYASGTIKSRDQHQVYANVNGIITRIQVTEGSLVKKGDVLMTIRNDASILNMESAKIAARYADIASNSNKLKEARASVDMARAKMRNDSLLYVRQRNLKAQGVGTQVALEQLELAFKNSSINYQLAVLAYQELRRDLLFAHEQSRTNLEISKTLLNDYSVRAETDGRVYKVFKERGEFTTTVSPVAVIGNAHDFLIELNVDEYDISRIRIGQRVLFFMDSYKGELFEARVDQIEPLMNEQSRSFIVKAAFVTRPTELYPNLSVEANIVIRHKEKALTIPRSFLISDSLVIVDKDKVRKVQTGIMDYQKVEILNGLSESEPIYKADR